MKIKDLQLKQQQLDDFIIKNNNIQVSDSEMLKNMILACHDEISEVKESPDDVEEYIDVLHFVLSIANRCDLELSEYRIYSYENYKPTLGRLLLDFTRETKCFKHWSKKKGNTIPLNLNIMIDIIYGNCKRLGADMFEEYEKKYQINIERQKSGTY